MAFPLGWPNGYRNLWNLDYLDYHPRNADAQLISQLRSTMSIIDVTKAVEKIAREHTPAILTAFGVTGTVTTAVLAGKAAYNSYPVIEQYEDEHGLPDSNREMHINRIKAAWKLYIPAGVSGAATITCIIVASRVGTRRTAAITAAYSLSEKAFEEYKEKVVEKIGKTKEQKVRDEVAQDRVNKNPNNQVIIAGAGNHLCYEGFTGRYFNCDMETLRGAVNHINQQMINHNHQFLDDFYDLVGLNSTSYSSEIGWDNTRLLELRYSTVLADNNQPCLSFEYNYTTPI